MDLSTAELLYEFKFQLTGVIDYGTSLEAILGGTPPPAAGARFELAFAGEVNGPKLQGKIKGADYASVRADGRFDLEVRATIETTDGARIAVIAKGTAAPSPQLGLKIIESAQWHTSAPQYQWINHAYGVGVGGGNPMGEMTLRFYLP